MVTINDLQLEILHVYAPSGKEATNFLASHKPSKNIIKAGDFNSHHTMWYAAKAPG